MKPISTHRAPAAIGPYSQAVVSAGMVYASGQIALDPSSGELVTEPFADQVQRVLDNVVAVLEAAGSSRDRVVKATVYVTDMGRFAELNEIYARFFGEHRPARAVVEVAALPKGVDVEMDVIAEAG